MDESPLSEPLQEQVIERLAPKTFRAKVRNIFIAGLLVTMPAAVTIFVIFFIFKKLDQLLQPVGAGFVIPILSKILRLLPWDVGLPVGFDFPYLGIVATVFLIFLIGLFTTSWVGGKVVGAVETVLGKIPFVRALYVSAKQIIEAVVQPERKAFRQVVMVEFPRKGLYSIGFITGDSPAEVQALTDEYVVNVFLPTTPNPTTGFFLMIPKKDLIPLSLTVEEGFKMIVSAGIVGPNAKPNNKKQKAKAEAQEVGEELPRPS